CRSRPTRSLSQCQSVPLDSRPHTRMRAERFTRSQVRADEEMHAQRARAPHHEGGSNACDAAQMLSSQPRQAMALPEFCKATPIEVPSSPIQAVEFWPPAADWIHIG